VRARIDCRLGGRPFETLLDESVDMQDIIEIETRSFADIRIIVD